MEYEVYLRREVFDFLRQCRANQREELFALFREIGRDPHGRGDFTQRDRGGREMEVLVFRRYAVVYWADHPVKEVKITEVRFADR